MSHDTWIHRLAHLIARPLVESPVTPNHLTSLRLATGVGAALCYAVGQSGLNWAGSVLFLVSMLLDRADGALARMSGKTTAWGHTYDIVADAVCNTAILMAIGFGLRHSELGIWAPVMGIVAGLSVSFVFWSVLRLESHYGEGSTRFSAAAGFDPDDAVIAIPVCMALGWNEPLLWAAVTCAPLVSIYLHFRFSRSFPGRTRRRSTAAREPE